MYKVKILVLESEYLQMNSIITLLRNNNYSVDICSDNQKFLDLIYNELYDLYLIGIKELETKRLELMDLLTQYNDITMKMVLVSIPTMIKRTFQHNCDECIISNTNEMEILFRIKSLIRRQYQVHKDEIKIKTNIKYNIFRKKLYLDNKEALLGEKPMMILNYLLKFKNMYVSSTELEIGSYPSSYENRNGAIRFHIYKLRQVLGDDIIISSRTKGYKLIIK